MVAVGAAAFVCSATARTSAASEPTITVTKDPNCGCCTQWAEHLHVAGCTVELRDTNEINRVKARLGVPADLASCPTAEVAGYVIEGHVPAPAIRRLLSERPKGRGLAAPGMPIGSPGMEVPGAPPEEYSVIMFGTERQSYGHFKGATELGK
jgi:hypothetical protein